MTIRTLFILVLVVVVGVAGWLYFGGVNWLLTGNFG